MVNFKLRTIFLGLFLAVFSFISLLWASELGLPLPAGAIKVLEKSANFGPIKSSTEIYKSSLTRDRVLSFYKKEMVSAGWRQKQEGVYIKDKYLVMVVSSPANNKTKETEFSITTSNIPAKEEILAMRKAKPDKLIFMPVYPGSVQVFLWDLPTGVAGAYETESSIKGVVFFYKSGMLNYGWSLANETPAKTRTASTVSKVRLLFHRGNGETCTITISNISVGLSSRGKTTISVNYNAYAKVKP